jgi:hypothetical protein
VVSLKFSDGAVSAGGVCAVSSSVVIEVEIVVNFGSNGLEVDGDSENFGVKYLEMFVHIGFV